MTTLLGKFVTVDPGEDTGWSVWDGNKLLDAGTTKMWDFSDYLWEAAFRTICPGWAEMPDAPLADELTSIERVVCEDWRLYPWKLRTGDMDWDECRTARLIGSITAACRATGWIFELQPAKIKERAVAAGAESYFSRPLHENRHANDAIMHGVYRNALASGADWTDLTQK